MLNLSAHLVRFDLKDSWVQGNFKELFSGKEKEILKNRNFEMKGWEYAVYEGQADEKG